MNYINTKTLQYPISEQDIRDNNPLLAFPSPFVAPDNFAFVFTTPKPAFDSVLENVSEIAPTLTVKGTWQQEWKVVPLYTKTAEKNAALAENLVTQKLIKKEIIDSNRKLCESSGMTYTFSDSVGTIQTKDEDIRNVIAVTTTAMILKTQGVTDPVILFRDKENIVHSLTPDEAIQMGLTVQQFITSTYSDAWNKKVAIDGATTINNLNKIIL